MLAVLAVLMVLLCLCFCDGASRAVEGMPCACVHAFPIEELWLMCLARKRKHKRTCTHFPPSLPSNLLPIPFLRLAFQLLKGRLKQRSLAA